MVVTHCPSIYVLHNRGQVLLLATQPLSNQPKQTHKQQQKPTSFIHLGQWKGSECKGFVAKPKDSHKICTQAHICAIKNTSYTSYSFLVNSLMLTFANGTIPFNLVAAASYSGASLLQCPHLLLKKKKRSDSLYNTNSTHISFLSRTSNHITTLFFWRQGLDTQSPGYDLHSFSLSYTDLDMLYQLFNIKL